MTTKTRGAKAPHNYPKKRKPTGPRPTAGRPANLVNPVIVTIRIEADDRDWLLTQGATVAEAIRVLIKAARSEGKCNEQIRELVFAKSGFVYESTCGDLFIPYPGEEPSQNQSGGINGNLENL